MLIVTPAPALITASLIRQLGSVTHEQVGVFLQKFVQQIWMIIAFLISTPNRFTWVEAPKTLKIFMISDITVLEVVGQNA